MNTTTISCNTTTTTKKPSKGRKKIEIKKIEALNHRQVTFSKRRAGLFKKSGELCILTGAQAAVIVNSPGGRLFAFGHPSVDTVIDRYLNNNNNNNNNNASTSQGLVINSQIPPPVVAEFNRRYAEVVEELEAEKRRRAVVVRRSTVADGGGLRWFEEDVGGMEVEELQEYLTSLVELRRKVVVRADELMMIRKTPVVFGRNVYGDGGGGGGWADDGGGVVVPTGGVTPVDFDYDIGVNDIRESMHY